MLMSFMWQLKHLEVSLLSPSSSSCFILSLVVCVASSTGDPDDNMDVLNIAQNKKKIN